MPLTRIFFPARLQASSSRLILQASDADEVAHALVWVLVDDPGPAIKRRLGEQQLTLCEGVEPRAATLDGHHAVVTG
jgi:hypothetical protein